MKKTYVKPIVTFESFAFSSNIAAGCSAINGIQAESSSPPCAAYGTQSSPENGCLFINGGAILFLDAPCVDIPQDDKHDTCYHVPTDATRMFMS